MNESREIQAGAVVPADSAQPSRPRASPDREDRIHSSEYRAITVSASSEGYIEAVDWVVGGPPVPWKRRPELLQRPRPAPSQSLFGAEREGRGATLKLLPLCDFVLSGDTGTTTVVPLGHPIPAGRWRSGALVVRFHSASQWDSDTAVAQIAVVQLSITPEQPDVFFVGTDLAVVQIGRTDAGNTPVLYVAGFSAVIPDHVRLVLRFLQGGTLGAAAFAISADVVWRTQ